MLTIKIWLYKMRQEKIILLNIRKGEKYYGKKN